MSTTTEPTLTSAPAIIPLERRGPIAPVWHTVVLIAVLLAMSLEWLLSGRPASSDMFRHFGIKL